jgi:hypothetical protein
MTMLTKTQIALVATLLVTSAPLALADGEFDANLGNRYPSYNGPRNALQSAAMASRRADDRRTAPVHLQTPGFGAPVVHGDGHLPRAFYDQEQAGFPQSPPDGGR